MVTNPFDKIFEKARESDAFWQEMAILGFTEAVSERLASLDMSRTDLAQKLRSYPSFVTKLMRGKNNFTIRTMVSVARALGCELSIGLNPTLTSAVACGITEAPSQIISLNQFVPNNENSSIFELVKSPDTGFRDPGKMIKALNEYADLAAAA